MQAHAARQLWLDCESGIIHGLGFVDDRLILSLNNTLTNTCCHTAADSLGRGLVRRVAQQRSLTEMVDGHWR